MAKALVLALEVTVLQGVSTRKVQTNTKRLCSTEFSKDQISRLMRIFPNRASCLRLMTASAMKKSEEWETGKRYPDMAELQGASLSTDGHHEGGDITHSTRHNLDIWGSDN